MFWAYWQSARPLGGAIKMRPQLIFKAIFFTILIPVVVTIFVPFFILGGSFIQQGFELSVLKVFTAFIGVIAGGILLHCIWGFAFYGKGTLAPIHPPECLVIRGFYTYTRNPMYFSVVVVLLTETIFFQSLSLLIYTAIIFLGFHMFVRYYEEPHLKNKFGEQYLKYCQMVPRWGITIHTFNNIDNAA
jgi:protein-S-isoprenylcysteine O-methyltransferase Ste14